MQSTFGDIHQNVGAWLRRLAIYLQRPHVYDIGAHTGMFSHALAREGCSVTAFEPVPATLKKLYTAIAGQETGDRIQVVERGVSNSDEHMLIHQFSDETFNSLFARSDQQQREYQLTSSGHAEIHVQPLDSIQRERQLPLPGLMKVDIEGAELYALQGARRVIAESSPYIVIEYSTENCRNAGYERLEIVHELQRHEYAVFGLFRNRDEHLYGAARFDDPRIWNLLAVPGTSAAAFQQDFASYFASS